MHRRAFLVSTLPVTAAASGVTHGKLAHIRVFDVDVHRGHVSHGKAFVAGFLPALMRCDVDGTIGCGMGRGGPKEDCVRYHSAAGELLGKIHACVNTRGAAQP